MLQHFEVAEAQAAAVLRALDKLDKEGDAAVRAELERHGMSGKAAGELYRIVSARQGTRDTLATLSELGLRNELYQQGVDELNKIVGAIGQFGVPDRAFSIDLSVVRGLDYYTGTIYETTLTQHPDIGSICSGGRYDDLASYFTNTRLPGVGISIGLSRLFARLKEANLLKPLARTPAEVLVTTLDANYLDDYLRLAGSLRAEGVNTEVYLERAKIGKQFEYANRKGFRIAITAGVDDFGRGAVKVKDLSTQIESDVPLAQVVNRVKGMLAESNSKAH
jgi:histidyl-tRNA synthetase